MQIVDAQIHLWGTGLPSNLSHRQVTAFTPAEAIGLMDEGGVDAAIIHPPGWDPGSTEMAFAAVRNYPGRFAIMGVVPLDRPESRARIAGWRQQPGMLGLRYGFLNDPMRRWLHDGTLDWLWAEAEKAGVPIAMLATDSLTAIGRIAERPVDLAIERALAKGYHRRAPRDDPIGEILHGIVELGRLHDAIDERAGRLACGLGRSAGSGRRSDREHPAQRRRRGHLADREHGADKQPHHDARQA